MIGKWLCRLGWHLERFGEYTTGRTHWHYARCLRCGHYKEWR